MKLLWLAMARTQLANLWDLVMVYMVRDILYVSSVNFETCFNVMIINDNV